MPETTTPNPTPEPTTEQAPQEPPKPPPEPKQPTPEEIQALNIEMQAVLTKHGFQMVPQMQAIPQGNGMLVTPILSLIKKPDDVKSQILKP
jgi:hypothetical protein|tara:strand:+ start:501 stop:773 length:273 start_codon:yes stop_codon:yes gene_type:complete